MATATLDRLAVGPQGRNEAGRNEEVTRVAHITGLTSTDAAGIVAEMLSATGLPASGSTITVGSDTLYLVQLIPVLTRDQQTSGEVRLVYRRRELSSDAPGGTVPTLQGGAALKQVTTQLDANGDPITVEHTWPADDPDFPGETHVQGGEIQVDAAMSELVGTIVVQTASPGAIADSWVNYVNSNNWQNGEPRTWKCQRVPFTLLDDTTSPDTWELSFHFEKDRQTWDNDTTAIFIDPRTGRPPENLVENEGYKKIQYYPARNFGELF